jgi:hypothetical protein
MKLMFRLLSKYVLTAKWSWTGQRGFYRLGLLFVNSTYLTPWEATKTKSSWASFQIAEARMVYLDGSCFWCINVWMLYDIRFLAIAISVREMRQSFNWNLRLVWPCMSSSLRHINTFITLWRMEILGKLIIPQRIRKFPPDLTMSQTASQWTLPESAWTQSRADCDTGNYLMVTTVGGGG